MEERINFNIEINKLITELNKYKDGYQNLIKIIQKLSNDKDIIVKDNQQLKVEINNLKITVKENIDDINKKENEIVNLNQQLKNNTE